jgi:hypothetical protein
LFQMVECRVKQFQHIHIRSRHGTHINLCPEPTLFQRTRRDLMFLCKFQRYINLTCICIPTGSNETFFALARFFGGRGRSSSDIFEDKNGLMSTADGLDMSPRLVARVGNPRM